MTNQDMQEIRKSLAAKKSAKTKQRKEVMMLDRIRESNAEITRLNESNADLLAIIDRKDKRLYQVRKQVKVLYTALVVIAVIAIGFIL